MEAIPGLGAPSPQLAGTWGRDLKLFPHSNMLMNGGSFYNALHIMLTEFGGQVAFLSSGPGTLTTTLSFNEVTALVSPTGDGWRAARERTAALAGTQLAAHGWAGLARPSLGLGGTSLRILPA